MIDPKLIVYGDQSKTCSRISEMFKQNFEYYNISIKKNLVDSVKSSQADACILCSCHAKKKEIDKLSDIKESVSPLPVIICMKDLNPEFIVEGVQKGMMNFMVCSKPRKEIKNHLIRIINNDGIRQLLESYIDNNQYSPYTNSIITEIIHSSLDQIQLPDLAERIGVSTRWLQVILKKIFSMTFTQIKHKVTLYQALNLMKYSQLDNTEIAMKIGYSDENSIARLFRKELGYSPSILRQKIVKTTPKKLIKTV